MSSPASQTSNAPISLIKLGGSLITDKKREKTARTDVIERLGAEIAELRRVDLGRRWILGHGSGSFGHVEAERSRAHEGFTSADQLLGISATADEAARLHRMVIAALRNAGESPFSQAPSSGFVAEAGQAVELFTEPLLAALDLGLLPVVYGDVVMDRRQGCAICSTETVFLAWVRKLQESCRQVGSVYWLGETDGIYDSSGQPLDQLDEASAEALLGQVQGASGTDVTGGIRHRLQAVIELAGLGVTSWVGNGLVAGELGRAVLGSESHGTWIR